VTAAIRPLDPAREDEIDLVARRMRQTLEEVLGEARGREVYSLDWLRDRVRFHLDPARSTGAVFLAERGGVVVGHTIVRVEQEAGDPGVFGLFSTTWVAPEARRQGVANTLLERGEAWMRERALPRAATYTSTTNAPLIRLYEARSYRVGVRAEGMLELTRPL